MGALISWKNRLYDATISASVAGSVQVNSVQFDGAYPAANVYCRDPSKVARINYVRNGTAGGYVSATFNWTSVIGGQLDAMTVAFMNVRIPAGATDVYARTYDYLGNTVITTLYTQANRVPIPGTTDRFNFFAAHGSNALCAAAALVVLLPPTTSDYIEIGEAWAGPALNFDEGARPDWKLGIVDPSAVERSRGGAIVSSQMPRRRTLTASFDSRTYNLAMGVPGTAATLSYRQFMQEAGNSSPLIVLPRTPLVVATPTTAELHALQTMGMHASFIGQQEIGHLGGNLFRATAKFEEIR